MKTPQERFDAMGEARQKLITDIAKKHGVGPLDLFSDQAKRMASDQARQEAARAMRQAGISVADIAEVFGVSKVSINNAVREGR